MLAQKERKNKLTVWTVIG